MATIPDNGEGFDLAAGFQTMIRTNEAIHQSVENLRQTIVASLDMQARYGSPSTAGAARQARDDLHGGGDATAGQTKSGGQPRTFEDLRQNAAQRINESLRNFATPAGWTGGSGSGGGPSARAGQAPSPDNRPPVGFGPSDPTTSYGGPGGPGGGGGGTGGGGGGPSGYPVPIPGPTGGSSKVGALGTPGLDKTIRSIPVIGAVVSGVVGAYDEFHSQVAKNDYYRNIEGGSMGNAVGERAREELYRYQTMGWYSEAEARQAFKGVTRIGYTDRSDQRVGTSRQDALDYVYNAKKSRGQDVSEGLSQLSVASHSLSIDLGTLQNAMEGVSDAAGKAGVNTNMARAQMTQMMGMGIQAGMGNGAVTNAQSIVQTYSSYGRAFAQNTDASGMYSQSMQYRAAAMGGESIGALFNQSRHDPVAWAGNMNRIEQQSLNSLISPQMRSWIQDQVKANGGVDAIRNQPQIANDIADQFFTQFQNQINPYAFTQVAQNLSGMNFNNNPEMAAVWVIQQVAGNTVSATAAKTQAAMKTTDLKGRMANGQKNAGVSSSLEKFGDLTTDTTWDWNGFNKHQATAAQDYVKGARKSGRRDPVLEALLQSKDLRGDKGNATKVLVHAANGDKIVTLDQAIKQFPNEVAAGDVTFVEGDAKGKSVSDLTGGKVDTKRDYRAELKQKVNGAAADAAAASAQGQQLLGLTPQAATLVQIMQQGGNYGAAAASGTPLAPSTNGSRTAGPQ